MVWIVVSWCQEMDSEAPRMEAFKSKESAVEYMINRVKKVWKLSEVLGEYKTWKHLNQALIDEREPHININDFSYYTVKKLSRS